MNHRRFRPMLIISILSVSASAQESEEDVKTIDLDEAPPVAEEACFLRSRIRAFAALDDGFVYVEGRRGEGYLLTMFPGCRGLGGAIGIGISSNYGRVCSNSAAEIVYRGLGRRQTCLISKVESVPDPLSAQRIVEMRSNEE